MLIGISWISTTFRLLFQMMLTVSIQLVLMIASRQIIAVSIRTESMTMARQPIMTTQMTSSVLPVMTEEVCSVSILFGLFLSLINLRDDAYLPQQSYFVAIIARMHIIWNVAIYQVSLPQNCGSAQHV